MSEAVPNNGDGSDWYVTTSGTGIFAGEVASIRLDEKQLERLIHEVSRRLIEEMRRIANEGKPLP